MESKIYTSGFAIGDILAQMNTDHFAFMWLMNINEPTGRLARWGIYLQAYDFEIVHRKGTQDLNADAVSGPVLSLKNITYNDYNFT